MLGCVTLIIIISEYFFQAHDMLNFFFRVLILPGPEKMNLDGFTVSLDGWYPNGYIPKVPLTWAVKALSFYEFRHILYNIMMSLW